MTGIAGTVHAKDGLLQETKRRLTDLLRPKTARVIGRGHAAAETTTSLIVTGGNFQSGGVVRRRRGSGEDIASAAVGTAVAVVKY